MSEFPWHPKPGFDLSGKKALVVGCSTPVGRAIALTYAEAGADVAIASATLDGDEVMEAKRIAKEVASAGRSSFSQGWDVTLPTNVQVGMRQLVKEWGTPSILVYAADHMLTKEFARTGDAEFAKVQAINLHGAYYAARSFVKEQPEGGAGRIIFVNTIMAERGIENISAYTSAKAGVTGLSAALSQELGARGITSNCISTGWMDFTPGRGAGEIGNNLLLRFIPMRRFGHADEVAGLAVLLASDASGYLNGQVFHVDGGVTQHL